MERIKEKVSVNLLNLKEKEYFDNPAEVKNIGVRWTARLFSGPDDGPIVSLSDHMFYQKEYMEYATLQSFKDSKSEGRIICDLLSFESFAIDGNFIVEVKIELEHSLHEDKDEKISPYYDKPAQYPTYSAGETEALLYSHIGSVYTNPSLTLSSQHAIPTHSCSCCHSFHGHHPRFVSSTLNRSNKPNIVQAQLQQCSPYHTIHQGREYFPSPVRTLRRTCSGRLHSSPSTTSSTPSSSTWAQDVDWKTKAETVVDTSDPDQIYSYIPDFFFTDSVRAPSNNSVTSVQYSEYNESLPRHQECSLFKKGGDDEDVLPYSDSNLLDASKGQPNVDKSSSNKAPAFQQHALKSSGFIPPTTFKSASVTSLPSSIIDSIYTGKTPDPTLIMRHRRKFLELGLKQNLPMLVKECEESYLHTLRVENCLETLLVVDNFLPESRLKDEVIKFTRVNLKEVMKDPNWGKFVEYCSELVMEILSTEMDHHTNV